MPIVLATVILMWATKPINFGDTKWYARNLLAHERGDFHEEGSRLWEFGHLIERPLGYAAYQLLKPFGRSRGWSDYLTARTSLVGISVICALILAFWASFQSLARRAGASAAGSFFIAPGRNGLEWTAHVRRIGNWLHSGTFVSGRGVVVRHYTVRVRRDRRIMLALSACFWFPYVLSAPAVLAAGVCWARTNWTWDGPESRERFRRCAIAALSAAGLIAFLYAVAALSLGIHSIAEFKSWAGSASHGWSQTRNLARLISGLPRGFVSLEGGITFKRYLLHDPYAQVTRWDLLRAGLWKLALFYGTTAWLVLALARSRRNWLILLLLGCRRGRQ